MLYESRHFRGVWQPCKTNVLIYQPLEMNDCNFFCVISCIISALVNYSRSPPSPPPPPPPCPVTGSTCCSLRKVQENSIILLPPSLLPLFYCTCMQYYYFHHSYPHYTVHRIIQMNDHLSLILAYKPLKKILQKNPTQQTLPSKFYK